MPPSHIASFRSCRAALFRCIVRRLIDYCVLGAAAAVIDLNHDPIEGDDELIVDLMEDLSMGSRDNAHYHHDNASDEDDHDGLCLLGWRLHQFDVLDHVFDDIIGDMEWGDKDFNHDNPDAEDA